MSSFVGDLITTYNAETGRVKEKTGTAFRSNVKDEDLDLFYQLLDNYNYPARLLGAMLASYGFALEKKEAEQNKLIKLQELASELGYELIKKKEKEEVLQDIDNQKENTTIQ